MDLIQSNIGGIDVGLDSHAYIDVAIIKTGSDSTNHLSGQGLYIILVCVISAASVQAVAQLRNGCAKALLVLTSQTSMYA